MAGVQSFSSLCNNMYDEADNEGEEEKDVDDQEVHIRMAPQSELLNTIKKTIAATLPQSLSVSLDTWTDSQV